MLNTECSTLKVPAGNLHLQFMSRLIPIFFLLSCSLSLADSHTDASTGYTIKFPDKWDVDEADAVIANAPDHLASMVVISFKDAKDAAEALQRLDRDDVMGNQIKSIRPADKIVSK